MVAIEVLLVDAVVRTMVRRRVEHLLERPHPIDQFGVDPELIDEIQGSGGLDDRGPEPEVRHEPVGHEHAEHIGHRLTQRGGEVVVLARVVHDMDRPEPAALVLDAMVPVVDEVPQDERAGGGRDAGAEVAGASAAFPQAAGGGARGPGRGRGDHAGSDGGDTRRWADPLRPSGQAVVGGSAGEHVGGRGECGGADGGADQGGAVPAATGLHGSERLREREGGIEAGGSHDQTGDRVATLVAHDRVLAGLLALRRRGMLHGDRSEESGGGEVDQVHRRPS